MTRFFKGERNHASIFGCCFLILLESSAVPVKAALELRYVWTILIGTVRAVSIPALGGAVTDLQTGDVRSWFDSFTLQTG